MLNFGYFLQKLLKTQTSSLILFGACVGAEHSGTQKMSLVSVELI